MRSASLFCKLLAKAWDRDYCCPRLGRSSNVRQNVIHSGDVGRSPTYGEAQSITSIRASSEVAELHTAKAST